MNKNGKAAQMFLAQRAEERKLALKHAGYFKIEDADVKALGRFKSMPLDKRVRVQKKGDKK